MLCEWTMSHLRHYFYNKKKGNNRYLQGKYLNRYHKHNSDTNAITYKQQKCYWKSKQDTTVINSLVNETARYAGRLKIPCGRRPQALRDRLCTSITHIKTATGTRRLNNFNPWTVLRLISGSHLIRPRTLLFIKPFIDRGPRSESTLDLSQGPNRFSIHV